VASVALGLQALELIVLKHAGPNTAASLEQLKLELFLLNLFVTLAVVGFMLVRYRVGVGAIGWRKTDFTRSLLYVIATLVAFQVGATVVLFLLGKVVPGFNPSQGQQLIGIPASGQHRAIVFLMLVVLPPVFEETVFRGFLFPAMAQRWGVVQGGLASSILFGLAHAQANLDLYTYILALVLCFIYVRLKSILPGMALHMLNNYSAFMALTTK
jgi:membrane protease YdiL (CAAX protease family)